MKIKTAVKRSRLDGLIAIRDKLSRELDECTSPREIPALTRQLRDTLKEIEAIQGKPEETAAGKTVLELVRSKRKKA